MWCSLESHLMSLSSTACRTDSGTFPTGMPSVTLLCKIAALSLETARDRVVSVPMLAVDIENDMRGIVSPARGNPSPGAGQL